MQECYARLGLTASLRSNCRTCLSETDTIAGGGGCDVTHFPGCFLFLITFSSHSPGLVLGSCYGRTHDQPPALQATAQYWYTATSYNGLANLVRTAPVAPNQLLSLSRGLAVRGKSYYSRPNMHQIMHHSFVAGDVFFCRLPD